MEVESILGTLMLGQVHAAISVSEARSLCKPIRLVVETVFFKMEFFIVLYLSPADYEFREGDCLPKKLHGKCPSKMSL